MTGSANSWVAIAAGALDVRDHEFGTQAGGGLLLTPLVPGAPLLLHGTGETLWRRLAIEPIPDGDLTDDDRQTVREMEEMGLASREVDHPSRITRIDRPWMLSPLHELVYALLAHVCAQNGIDVVFIKGPTLHAQGLRERAHSGDVDCWVRPRDDLRLARAMQPWGWTPALSAFSGTDVLHSLTLRAGLWGSAIDVHSWFPGMAMDAAVAFAVVHDTAEHRQFASVSVRTPEPAMHAVISALHEVRPFQGSPAGPSQIESASATLAKAGRPVVDAAQSAHAEYALHAALHEAFPDHVLDVTSLPVPKDWAWRLSTSPRRVYIEALKLIPLKDRPRVIFRVLWPTAESLHAGPAADGVSSTRQIRIRRAMQGIRLFRQRGRK